MAIQKERCCICDDPTGRAGIAEDSIYRCDSKLGPLCEECNRILDDEAEVAITTAFHVLIQRWVATARATEHEYYSDYMAYDSCAEDLRDLVSGSG